MEIAYLMGQILGIIILVLIIIWLGKKLRDKTEDYVKRKKLERKSRI